ncbi:MAG TPA: dihydropteroate synthase [Saprospiraceae bacterium]|nr:dihydropteroate synthase [Saprospiraceae bacterium]
MLHPQASINCRGQLIDLSSPKIMGILNVTPDSFYDGGQFNAADAALAQTEKMLEAGATFIDVGGMSSRPGAELISPEEELARVGPVVEAIRKRFPACLLSIDTVYGKTIRQLSDLGVDLINDISAGSIDSDIQRAAADLGIPYILMHMAGKPENMQQQTDYEDVVEEILDFFIEQVGSLRAKGCKDIILDPGFGFGKKLEHNYQLLNNLHVFKVLGLPMMTGLSRKSMVWKLLGTSPEEALNGSSILHFIALQQGSRLLRVHDVAPAMEVIKIWQQIEIR